MAVLTLRLVPGGVQASCGCGLRLIVLAREVPARCPKCRGEWTRTATVETTRRAPR